MADSDRRIVLDGLELAQFVKFPAILRAVTGGFQLSRLLLGLFIVAVLLSAGRAWDGVTGPEVAPAGLVDEPWSQRHATRARDVMEQGLQRYEVPPERWPDELTAPAVFDLLRVAYGERRAPLLEQAAADDEEAADRLTEADRQYLETVAAIEAARPRGIFEATVDHVSGNFNVMAAGLVTLDLNVFFGGARDLLIHTPMGAWRHDRMFAVVYGLFFLIVLGLGGGAIARMAAVETALGERLRLQEAVDFMLSAWRRLIFSLLLPLLIAALLGVLLLAAGWFLMLPWLDVLGGLLYGLALLLGFGIVFLLVGYALGFSLLVPAVACENCDAADAQQRAYAYVLSRPLHLLGYGIVGIVGLALGYLVAGLFAVAVLNVTGWLVDWASGNPAASVSHGFALFDLSPQRATALPLAAHSAWSATLIMLWQAVVVALVAGYVFSYYFSASTAIYLLMRRTCDGQEITEVWQPGDVPGTTVEEPEPPTETDAAAVEASPPEEDER